MDLSSLEDELSSSDYDSSPLAGVPFSEVPGSKEHDYLFRDALLEMGYTDEAILSACALLGDEFTDIGSIIEQMEVLKALQISPDSTSAPLPSTSAPLASARGSAVVQRVDDGTVENCTICLLPLTSGIKHLICSHKFHRECIDGWMATRLTEDRSLVCPNCRQSVEEIEEVKMVDDESAVNEWLGADETISTLSVVNAEVIYTLSVDEQSIETQLISAGHSPADVRWAIRSVLESGMSLTMESVGVVVAVMRQSEALADGREDVKEEVKEEGGEEQSFVGDCTICLCALSDGHSLALDCGHLFHWECLQTLIATNKSERPSRDVPCPLCRKSIDC